MTDLDRCLRAIELYTLIHLDHQTTLLRQAELDRLLKVLTPREQKRYYAVVQRLQKEEPFLPLAEASAPPAGTVDNPLPEPPLEWP